MSRQWAPFPEYEGIYEVSDDGSVRSVDRVDCRGRRLKGITLSLTTDREGYKKIRLFKLGKGKNFSVHRMVAISFIGITPDKPMVNHINGLKGDNRVENLEWCDGSWNIQHAVLTGLKKPSPNTVAGGVNSNYKGDILATNISSGEVVRIVGTVDALAKGFTPESICRCLSGKLKTHRGFSFVRIQKGLNL